MQVNWIFGITWCVFLSWANSTARCRWCFVAEFYQVYIVFLVVTSFAKTECYSPSNLLVRSATYRTSGTYQLLTCWKCYVASLQAFHDHFSHETYKHHASTVTCSESKLRNPPGQNDHSKQKQTTCWKYFFVSIIILGHELHWQCSLVFLCIMEYTQTDPQSWPHCPAYGVYIWHIKTHRAGPTALYIMYCIWL